MRLMSTNTMWIWRNPNWPELRYDAATAAPDLADTYRMHGVLEGKASAIGLGSTSDVALDALADEVLATAAIEGERLSPDAVRSSVMRRLGLATSGPSDRHVDGLVEVLSDATSAFDQPLDADRLCRWQSALFPGGTSGIQRIVVGRYRDHDEPMQIVSGLPGREVVHYEAPASQDVPAQMDRFLAWFAESAPNQGGTTTGHRKPVDGFARAAIAHLWFESIHPFEDGNGRIGRAIVDMAVAQHLRQPVRLYSLSRQLKVAHSGYYDALNEAQRGSADVTPWVQWFARQCTAACVVASQVIDQAIEKKRFWETTAGDGLNDRQRKVLQRLLDAGDGGFTGGMNAEKYMKMTGASKATATRDLADLTEHARLWTDGTGKAVRYYINVPGWAHGVKAEASFNTPAHAPSAPVDAAEVARSAEALRSALEVDGFHVAEHSGDSDRSYFGPVVAVTALHVGQDLGRRRAVIHEVSALAKTPTIGQRLEITFKGGRASVLDMNEPGPERGR